MLPKRRFEGVWRNANVSRPVSCASIEFAKMMVLRVVPNNKQSKKPLHEIMAPAKQKYPTGTSAPAMVEIRPAANGRVQAT